MTVQGTDTDDTLAKLNASIIADGQGKGGITRNEAGAGAKFVTCKDYDKVLACNWWSFDNLDPSKTYTFAITYDGKCSFEPEAIITGKSRLGAFYDALDKTGSGMGKVNDPELEKLGTGTYWSSALFNKETSVSLLQMTTGKETLTSESTTLSTLPEGVTVVMTKTFDGYKGDAVVSKVATSSTTDKT